MRKFVKGLVTQMFTLRVSVLMLALLTIASVAGATSGDPAGLDKLDKLIEVIATWLGRIGLIVAFFGAVQLALGFKGDDADGKIRGMKTLAAGFLVWGITQSLSLFGL